MAYTLASNEEISLIMPDYDRNIMSEYDNKYVNMYIIRNDRGVYEKKDKTK